MFRTLYNKIKEKRSFDRFLHEGTNVHLKNGLNHLCNKKNKETLRVLGNGSSLKNSLLLFDDKTDYMVVNSHVLDESYSLLKPKYYVLADPSFFTSKEGYDILKAIANKTKWNMMLFVPDQHVKKCGYLQKIKSNYINIIHYNGYEYYGPESKRQYCYDCNLAMPSVENVMVASLYIAIYLGYKTVELYGVEHSWTKSLYVNDHNQVCLHDDHFYDKEKISDRIFTKSDGSYFKTHEILKMYSRMFESYWEIKEIANRKGVEIVNYTPHSFIDAFVKKNI